jgi:hypothetical protein
MLDSRIDVFGFSRFNRGMKFIRLLILPLLIICIFFGNGCATSSTSSAGKEFVGTWAADDSDQDLFNIVVYPDGTAITNWAKGETGAKGEFGRWIAEPGRITISYDDGWCDILMRKGSGYRHLSYGPGVSRSGKPTNQGPATRVKGERLAFVGVWEMASATNDAPFFMALKSDGTALKTVAPKSKGKWKVTDGAAVSTWSDGWTDIIRRSANGWVNEARKPGVSLKEPPTATCSTAMVGND